MTVLSVCRPTPQGGVLYTAVVNRVYEVAPQVGASLPPPCCSAWASGWRVGVL